MLIPVPTLTVAYCRVLTDYLQSRGQPLAPVLAALGLSAAELGDSERRVPRQRFNEALELAARNTGDDFLGLHAGEHIRPAHYGVLGYMMMSCDTSRQLIERHRRWHQLVARGTTVEYEEAGSLLWMRESLPPLAGLVTRAGSECNLASTLTYARWVFGNRFRPVEVHFPYPPPPLLGEYQRIFQCRLVFDAPQIGLAIHNDQLDRPLPQADAELCQLMEAKAQRQATELGIDEDAFTGQLRGVIARLLPKTVPDMDMVAAALNMSARTLQRRLAERDSHFKAALDQVRRDLALSHVGDPQLALIDIAFLLGFSQQSAFNRAFRRWTGIAPGTYRERAQS